MVLGESLIEHVADKVDTYGWLANHIEWMANRDETAYDDAVMNNGKKMREAAEELEKTIGEATLIRAFFSGDKAAIRKISRAAVDIYPQKVTPGAWSAIATVGGKEGARELAECFVGASLLAEGRMPPDDVGVAFAASHLPVKNFYGINSKQQKAMLEQAKQARDRLGAKFDQAFYNFDEKAARQAMKAVHKDLLVNWEPVMTGNSFADKFGRRT